MRRTPLIILLVVIALGAFAYVKRDVFLPKLQRLRGPAPSEEPTPGPTAPAVPATMPAPFTSKLPPPPVTPGEKQFAPPGTFYMVERVVLTDRDGVHAVRPGEHVKLLERMSNGKLRVTIDDDDFVVKKEQVTDDVDVARAAEEKYRITPMR